MRNRKKQEAGRRSGGGFCLQAWAEAVVLSVGTAYIFYRSLPGLVPGIAVGVYGYRAARRRAAEAEKLKKKKEFKALITAMQGSLEAGASMEHALTQAGADLEQTSGKRPAILSEVERMKQELQINVPFEKAFENFAVRMQISEITDFAEVLTAIRRSGGNAIRIIRETAEKISANISLDEEIGTMVAGKQMEQRIMTFMPAFILLFLQFSGDGFTDPLYESFFGVCFMTVALVCNVAADFLGKRIVRITAG